MPIDPAQIHHLARLSRLQISAEEAVSFSHDLEEIMAYCDRLKRAAPTETSHSMPKSMTRKALRGDHAEPSLGQGQALAEAPETSDGFFEVPEVIRR